MTMPTMVTADNDADNISTAPPTPIASPPGSDVTADNDFANDVDPEERHNLGDKDGDEYPAPPAYDGDDEPMERRRSKMDLHGIRSKSLEDQASCLSDWFLIYLDPLLKHGSTNVIDAEDIGVPSKRDRAGPIFELAQELWHAEMERVRSLNDERLEAYQVKSDRMPVEKRAKAKPFKPVEPSVAAVLMRGFGRGKVVISIFLYVCSALLTFVPVLLLNDLVRFFEIGRGMANWREVTMFHPWVEVVGLGIIPLAVSILQTRSVVMFQHLAIFIRTAVSTLLYEKSLNVSAAGRAATSTGQGSRASYNCRGHAPQHASSTSCASTARGPRSRPGEHLLREPRHPLPLAGPVPWPAQRTPDPPGAQGLLSSTHAVQALREAVTRSHIRESQREKGRQRVRGSASERERKRERERERETERERKRQKEREIDG